MYHLTYISNTHSFPYSILKLKKKRSEKALFFQIKALENLQKFQVSKLFQISRVCCLLVKLLFIDL